MTDVKPLGVDVSKYQASQDGTLHMDWNKVKAAGIQFAFVKASEGVGYIDAEFARNWGEMRRLGIPRGAYHFFRPLQSVSQVRQFVDLVDPQAGELLVLDLENSGGYSKLKLTEMVLDTLDLIWELAGRYPIIYSRASWLNEYLDVSALPRLDYWLAQYLKPRLWPFYTPEFPSDKITIPGGVDRSQIKFHQTGDKGNGSQYGAQSRYIDTDRFLGTEELHAYFGANTPPVISPEVKPLFQAMVIADVLIVRDAPAGVDTKERKLEGDVVDVFEISGDWYKVDGGWVSALWMSRIDLQPPVELNLLNVPVFSQNDPRWKNIQLGTSGTTIGWNGCLISTQCSVAGFFHFDINPAELNTWCNQHEGYLNTNWYVWNSLSRLFPDIQIATWIDCYNTPAPLIKIDEALARKEPCIVHVDFVPSTNIVNDHYITIDGKLPDGDYHIIDSWDGWRGSFKNRYVNPERFIYRIVSYRRR